MEKNYAFINGERVELTDEQCRSLGYEPKKDYGDLFERHMHGNYYYINDYSEVIKDEELDFPQDKARNDIGNYCADEEIMHQRALHEMLNRFLWRASVASGELDRPWDNNTEHWYIRYLDREKTFKAEAFYVTHTNSIHFPSPAAAEEAIETIIKPFVKAHPEFKW